MNTLAYCLVLSGLWVLRGVAKGRGIQEQWGDLGDMFIAFVQGDTEKMGEVASRTGSGLDFESSPPSSSGAVAAQSGQFATIVDLGKHAQSMGLSVREHPAFDKVDPVHTKNSDHYKNNTGTGGDAIDVSGGTEKNLVAFAQTAKDAGFYVLFNRPGFTNWPGHDTHVHVSDRRPRSGQQSTSLDPTTGMRGVK